MIAEGALDPEVAAVAHPTVDLDGFINAAMEHLGAVELAHGRLLGEGLAGVHQPGGAIDQRAQGLDLGGHVGDHPLDGLFVSDGHTELFPRLGPLDAGLQHCLRPAQAAGPQAEATHVQRLHKGDEAGSELAQHVLFGHTAVLENYLRCLGAAYAHLVFRPSHPNARKIPLHDEGRYPAPGSQGGIGDGHDAEDIGVAAVSVEGFGAVEDKVIAVAHSSGLDGRRIGAGIGLRKDEGPNLLSSGQWHKIFLLLLLRAAQVDGHGPDASMGADDCGRGGANPVQFLHEDAIADLSQPAATIFLREGNAQQAEFSRLP